MADDYLWIETADALQALCTRLGTSEWLALDTEFMRERTYYPKLCLVQVATPQVVACVDVLALASLEPLLTVLDNSRILKVLHSARQDLEMFFNLNGQVPAPLFDTQLAASFAGFPDQAGYATVVQGVLGVNLEKSHTRADWTRRPLSPAVRQYAADDVRYLREIYPRLKQKLETGQRLDWLQAETARLTDPATYRPDPDNVWQRLRGLQRLKSRQLAAVKALAAWRERTAMQSDLPRQWVLKDEVLIDLARQLPTTTDELRSVRSLPESTLTKHAEEWLALIAAARGETKLPPPPQRLSAAQEALVDALMSVLRLQGATAGVSQAQLASRAELEQLVRGNRDVPVLQGWRLETAGSALLELLEGKTTLAVKDDHLEIQTR
ncbi:MAG: ribonuclease D [Gammaproteobacteria bacterium]|nr:ribonuclease D [Gammaproteobacteria bacterium]MBU6510450.1 ribonuclease D [Gammaproteobacteria bacterium]MDE1984012.1 ribonuclease D [Gammaproteobacteria bacterium]MDE2109347.1 ribonuclease D [Gammaproteobacteria bacterium]